MFMRIILAGQVKTDNDFRRRYLTHKFDVKSTGGGECRLMGSMFSTKLD